MASTSLLGVASLAALWDRRRHPVGVAAFVVSASAISALAGGAALVVLFNAALRCDRRTLGWTALGDPRRLDRLRVDLRDGDADARDDVLIGVLLIGFTVGWGLFVRVRRDLVDSLHERAAGSRKRSGCAPTRRGRRSASGSRGRCTTCSPTGCRC